MKRPIETKIIKKNYQKSPDVNKILPYYKLFKKREAEQINNENSKIPFITEVGIKVQNNNFKNYNYYCWRPFFISSISFKYLSL